LKKEFIFKSERLGFRNWTEGDLKELEIMNSDLKVMEHLPKTLTKKENEEFLGFIGLAYQEYRTEFRKYHLYLYGEKF
jgi:hypothetical protein